MNKSIKNKVLLFGSFDVLHNGHFFLFQEAQKLGNLIIVVAQDKIIEDVKKQKPHKKINERISELKEYFKYNQIKNIPLIIKGDDKNEKWSSIKKYRPETIIVGYDQKELENALELVQKKYNFKIIKISSFKPEIYKSSILKKTNAN